MVVGLGVDLLTFEFFLSQQALENSGLSSIPAAAHPSDASHPKSSAVQGQDPDLPHVPSEPPGSGDAEPEKEQESPEKPDRKEKKLMKRKSPFLPGNLSVPTWPRLGGTLLVLKKRLFLLLKMMFVECSDSIYPIAFV